MVAKMRSLVTKAVFWKSTKLLLRYLRYLHGISSFFSSPTKMTLFFWNFRGDIICWGNLWRLPWYYSRNTFIYSWLSFAKNNNRAFGVFVDDSVQLSLAPQRVQKLCLFRKLSRWTAPRELNLGLAKSPFNRIFLRFSKVVDVWHRHEDLAPFFYARNGLIWKEFSLFAISGSLPPN